MREQYLPRAPLVAASTVTQQDQRASESSRRQLPENTAEAVLTAVDLERRRLHLVHMFEYGSSGRGTWCETWRVCDRSMPFE
jgi:hypothetical protein